MSTTIQFPTSREQIAGIDIVQLAGSFGTPLYVYDAQRIQDRIEDLKAFDCVRYAQKACSNLAILDRVRRWGAVVDAVSAGEIRRALKAGFAPGGDPPGIVYTADIFDAESLELVIEHDIHVNCGSPDMIDQLGEQRRGGGITLRINPGFGHGHSQKTNTGGPQSKHGIWHAQIGDCIKRASRHGMEIVGLHMHIGSGTDFEHLSQVCDAMQAAAMEIGNSIRSISAGGGLPVPYREGESYIDLAQYFELWDATRNRLAESFRHSVALEVEPGRYLSAEAGHLIAEIRAIKQMGENLFYVVNSGFNDLARPVMYGAYHPISICRRGGDPSGELVDAIIGGPLCESGDIFTQKEGGYVDSRRLPRAEVGDFVVLENAGAYGFVMASNYNSKRRPAEVLIEDGTAKLIRERETFEDLIRGERIPE